MLRYSINFIYRNSTNTEIPPAKRQQLDQEYNKYKENPASHPDYETKYQNFIIEYLGKFKSLQHTDHIQYMWNNFWHSYIDKQKSLETHSLTDVLNPITNVTDTSHFTSNNFNREYKSYQNNSNYEKSERNYSSYPSMSNFLEQVGDGFISENKNEKSISEIFKDHSKEKYKSMSLNQNIIENSNVNNPYLYNQPSTSNKGTSDKKLSEDSYKMLQEFSKELGMFSCSFKNMIDDLMKESPHTYQKKQMTDKSYDSFLLNMAIDRCGELNQDDDKNSEKYNYLIILCTKLLDVI